MIAITGLHAHRVNLLQNDFAAGLPSPFAFLGLIANISGRTGAERWDFGVLPIIHSIAHSPGRTKGHIIQDGKGTFKTKEIPEDLRGSVSFSLLVDLPDGCEQSLASGIAKARLAGGAIFPEHKSAIRVLNVPNDGTSLSVFKRGRLVAPLPKMPTIRGYDGEFEPYFNAIKPDPQDDDTPPGWRVPLAVGYHLLETPKDSTQRVGTRDPSLPHAFAEPIGGVGHLVSPKSASMRALGHQDLAALMWRYTTSASRITAHPFYQ